MSTVLVVDDDPHIRASLRRTLGFEGYRVREAADGIGALAAVAQERPELVILDLMLPGMDGVEVCRRLRQIDDVPVLMLTALERTPDRVKGLDAGADDYLVKPFATDELLARLRALLRRRTPGQEPRMHRLADLVLDEPSLRVARAGRLFEDARRDAVAICSPRVVTMERQGRLGRGTANRAVLRQTFRAFFDNVARHTPDSAAVAVGARGDERWIQLSVADTGPGVPAPALARIFDRFYRAEKSRHGQGSGLGLAIARSTLESHGGEVAAANLIGGGFRIEVKLPRYLEPGASRAEPTASRSRPGPTEDRAGGPTPLRTTG